jgi:hypothetical protein
MTREELIEQEAKEQTGWHDESDNRDVSMWKDGINSQLAKDLQELAVIEGKIEVYKSLNTHHHHEIYQLETQRTELLKQLNLEG